MEKLRIVFMGTPEFAVGILDTILQNNYEVVGVITAADKPAGRGQKIKYSAVKEYALANHEVSGVWGGTAGWSHRHRKGNIAYIERLKLTVEYERLRELPESNVKRKKIAKVLKERNAIKV